MLSNNASKQIQEEEEELGSSLPFPAALQQRYPMVIDAQVAWFEPPAFDRIPPRHSRRSGFCSFRSCRNILLAVIASVLAAVMLISLCSFALRGNKFPGFPNRVLSEDEDSSARHAACGATQQESDTSSSEDVADTSALRGSSEPSPKKRKRESEGKGESSGGAGATEAFPSLVPFLPAPGALHAGRTSDEALAVAALLMLQQAPGTAQPAGIEEPQPSTSSADVSEAASEVRAREQAKAGLTEGALSGPSLEGEELQQPGAPPHPSASGAEAAAALPLGVPADHVFFHLPSLEPGVVVRPFNRERARLPTITASYALNLLDQVRKLLAKDLLCQEEASSLLNATELLVAHCHHYHTKKPNDRSFYSASEMLGSRFMLLDAIVSSLQVLKVPLPEWWHGFAESIPHELPQRLVQLPESKQVLHRQLAEDLVSALGLLKTGVRPPPEKLYKLKYQLFCTDQTLSRFRKLAYMSWFKDCPD